MTLGLVGYQRLWQVYSVTCAECVTTITLVGAIRHFAQMSRRSAALRFLGKNSTQRSLQIEVFSIA
jgi:hypothetical protein